MALLGHFITFYLWPGQGDTTNKRQVSPSNPELLSPPLHMEALNESALYISTGGKKKCEFLFTLIMYVSMSSNYNFPQITTMF